MEELPTPENVRKFTSNQSNKTENDPKLTEFS